ncbi:hypothetical protein TIFTF001_005919 [Ficus carica]|uniref:Uncharacterized protein n=1 Tax=Ficus carica TaxID=3494 RepID=A0AA88A996_FICCA|nr:hypothetical protein TIFTF001_005919 [Ficus carica]
MASAGVIGGNWIPIKDKAATKKKTPMANRVRVCRASCSSSSVIDPYKTLRIEPGESTTQDIYGQYEYDQGIDEPMRGFNDPDYDMWEEWMGWEGAGIRDYSSHINPYI